MTTSSFLFDIQLTYDKLTKTEKKIADFVIQHTNQVFFMSITDLADACKVADASVHRFCRTMGAKGYQEFKMKLSLSMAPENVLPEGVAAGAMKVDSMDFTLDQILQTHIRALKETRMLMTDDAIIRAVSMMEEAKQICFFGVGDSLLTAREARNKFLRITPKVNSIDDPHMQAMMASLASPKDVVFLISYSGATKDTIHVAEIAKEAGIRAVGITKFGKSPLAKLVDMVLLCGSNERPLEGGSLAVKMSQLYIIDVLFQEYYRRNHEVSRENNKRTSKAVVEKLI